MKKNLGGLLYGFAKRFWRSCPDWIRVPSRNMIYSLIRLHTRGIVTIDLGNFSFQMLHKNNSEYWNIKMASQHEPEFLREYVQSIIKAPPPIVVYDIGANMGFYSLVAASISKSLGKKISIFAFEPDSTIFKVFNDNISLNGFDNISPFLLAVGNISLVDQCKFAVLAGEGGSTFIGKEKNNDNYEVDNARVVPIISLDVLVIMEKVPPPDIIKIDIEGYEYEVLKGTKNVLVNNKAKVFVEIHAEYLDRFGTSVLQVYEFMRGLGYQRIQLHEKGAGQSYGHQQEHVIFIID